jgi:hypothetical protein
LVNECPVRKDRAFSFTVPAFVACALELGDHAGTLYLVATPIGNLKDISQRALETLEAADLIACEDTRHSAKLLNAYGISKKLVSYHDHNEKSRSEELIELLKKGTSIALISDAGTPLINDPGYVIVQSARNAGMKVHPDSRSRRIRKRRDRFWAKDRKPLFWRVSAVSKRRKTQILAISCNDPGNASFLRIATSPCEISSRLRRDPRAEKCRSRSRTHQDSRRGRERKS